MRHDFIDRYSRLDSPLHRLPVWSKALAALAMAIACSCWPMRHAAWLALPACVLLTAALVSRIPLRCIATRMLMLEPFALGASLLALGQPDGWRLFATLLARTTLALATVILWSNLQPFAEVIALLRRLQCPALLVTTIALTYRYVFLFIDEAERMQRARASRTFLPSRRRRWSSLASVAGQLFIRATERAERVFAAMCARGWTP